MLLAAGEWRCDEGATTAGLVNLSGHYIANPQGAALDASSGQRNRILF